MTLFLLDRPSLTWLVLAGAIAAAVVGSFSSLQGLLIWPIGLVLLYLRRRSWRIMVVWVIAAIVTGAIYFYNYHANAGFSRPSYLVSHPFGAASFFLFSVGNNVTGQEVVTPTHIDLILGTLIVLVALWLVIACGLRRDATGGSALGVSLICFGLLFTAMITAGRAWEGYALAGRYAMFELLLWVGCYLALLERPIRGLRDTRAYLSERIDNWLGTPGRPIDHVSAVGRSRNAPWTQMVTVAVQLVLVSLILVQAVLNTRSGITDVSIWYQSQLVAADVAANIDEASDSLVQNDLGLYGDYPTSFIRQMMAAARSEHLSLFDTPLAAEDTRRGLFPSIQSSVGVPADFAIVSGTQVLDAGVFVSTAGTKVQFRITGGSSHRTLVVAARYSRVGWIAYWDTTTVADGSYEMQSVLVYPNRSRAAGAPISVTVENK